MAKLTESYLRNLIRQTLRENEGMYTPSGSPRLTEDSIQDLLNGAMRDLEEASITADADSKQDIGMAITKISHALTLLGVGLRESYKKTRR